MPGRVLHILSQRPGLTGSGITLDAIVQLAAEAGWQQAVVIGIPLGESVPTVGGLPQTAIHPVRFGGSEADLDFPVPGMSDVMPYPSSVWAQLTDDQLARYRAVWRDHLAGVIQDFRPDLIHCHHIWLVSSLLKNLAPELPVVATCHSTGLRQMELTPHLAAEVRQGCARLDHFCVLRKDHADQLQESLRIPSSHITIVGAGFRPELFQPTAPVQDRASDFLYVGKYSRAKGVPWLLDAFEQLHASCPELRLHIAGGGSGPEADKLRRRLTGLAPAVRRHGQLNQPELAALMNRCGVCVLPSFYEGVPLVLVEAAACGCQLVATTLPGIVERIAPQLGPQLDLVPLPRLVGVDQPDPNDLPRFVSDLTTAMAAAQARAQFPGDLPAAALDSFTWQAVFARVAEVWRKVRERTFP